MLRDAEERSYRAYVTDSLRLAPQMMYMSLRWIEVIEGAKNPTDEKTADEIIDDVIARLEKVRP